MDVLPRHTGLATFIKEILPWLREGELVDQLLFKCIRPACLGSTRVIHLVYFKSHGINYNVVTWRFPASVCQVNATNEANLPVYHHEFLVMRIIDPIILRCRWTLE